LKNIEMRELLVFLREESREHFEAQRAYVTQQRNLKDMKLCPHENVCGMCSECEKLESQFGVDITTIREKMFDLETLGVARYTFFMSWFVNSRYGSILSLWLSPGDLREELYTLVKRFAVLYVAIILLALFIPNFIALLFVLPVLFYLQVCIKIEQRKREVVEMLTSFQRPSIVLRDACDKADGRFAMKALGAFASIALFYALYRRWQKTVSQAAAPIALKKEYEGEIRKEFWSPKDEPEVIQRTHVERSTTIDDIQSTVSKRLSHIRVLKDGVWYGNDVFPLKGNVWILPNHAVPADKSQAVVTRPGGHTNKCVVSASCCYHIPNTDLALWYAPELGEVKDCTRFFPEKYVKNRTYTFRRVFVTHEGEVQVSSLLSGALDRINTTEGGAFDCIRYVYDEETQKGTCMATLVGGAPTGIITGFHLAGSGRKAGAGILTQPQIAEAMEQLNQKPHIMTSHSQVSMPEEILGVNFGPLSDPHPKSAVNSVENVGHMRVYGQHTLPRAAHHSNVVPSKFSEDIAEVCDLPRVHDKPYNMSSPKHWEDDIAKKTDIAYDFDDKLIAKAVIDYQTTILSGLKSTDYEKVGKLPDDVIIAGMDGVKGVNAINFKSSLGFPESGPKTQFIEVSGRVVPGISVARDVDPKYWEEVARMERELLAGNRINTVFKGSLKDEPTKMTKTKVRVFAGCNLAFTMLVRKYFLTLSKLMMDNKELFECAVGVNVEGPEWEDLYNHIVKFGKDRIVAGDYASFDGRMSSKFMLAAFKVLINIAKKSGNYDEDDIMIMRGIASEICNPIYDFNGVLVELFGSNPSGHPLTVVINSIVNSLYVRYCYYSLGEKRNWVGLKRNLPLFRTVVALMTYGDDNIMSVKKGFDWFNHTALAQEFAKVGITYTMADKEAESIPFIGVDDASFLKNFFWFDEECSHIRSRIELGSIQKMLHAHLLSNALRPDEQAINGMVDAMDKWFGYGREEYDMRRDQLLEVARRNNAVATVESQLKTYDEQMARYMEQWE
jgi:hypothetical protein